MKKNQPFWKQITPSLQYHPDNQLIHYLSRQASIEPFLMQELFDRGISTEDKLWKFLFPNINDLYNPYLLNDMKKSVTRIINAIKRQETIMIFGDYDVDGICSTALLYNCLKHFKAKVLFRLPQRHEGYGISANAIEEIAALNVSLIITVDNGSSAHEALRVAKNHRIDVIVTDHHEIIGEFPNCYSFINPKRDDNNYPYINLSGSGVAFKLVQAIYQATSNLKWEKHIYKYIEFATLGTIADLMPLDGENRVICWLGIRKMNNNPCKVLRELFEILNLSYIDSTKISFQIAPIFNSVGRIDDPNKATKLLTSQFFAKESLLELISINRKRQMLTTEQFETAKHEILINGWEKDRIIVVKGDFHVGIIGIIAARIAETFHKPSIVISQSGTGSARTVQGSNFSIINSIKQTSEYLNRYGGHQGAAGLSIDISKIDLFRKAIQKVATNQQSSIPVIQFNCKFDFKQFPVLLFDDLYAMEPFGMGNPKPIFHCPNIQQVNKLEFFGNNREHVKITMNKKKILAFSKGHHFINPWTFLEFLYSPNCYKEKNFVINDVRTT